MITDRDMKDAKQWREFRYTIDMRTDKVSDIETRIRREGEEPSEWKPVTIQETKPGMVVRIPNLDR